MGDGTDGRMVHGGREYSGGRRGKESEKKKKVGGMRRDEEGGRGSKSGGGRSWRGVAESAERGFDFGRGKGFAAVEFGLGGADVSHEG